MSVFAVLPLKWGGSDSPLERVERGARLPKVSWGDLFTDLGASIDDDDPAVAGGSGMKLGFSSRALDGSLAIGGF